MRFWKTSTRVLMAAALTFVLPWPAIAQNNSTAAATASVPTVEVAQVSSISKPVVAARAWILVDAVTGQTIAAQNPEQSVEPASLT